MALCVYCDVNVMCVFSVVGVLYFVCFYLVFCVFVCCVWFFYVVLRVYYVCVVPVLCAAVVRCLL